ncbi:MAG: tRNA (adenosine(37)-N6)-dimethylallyltransferase MiaA [Patescibacteria group bacterium]
MLIVILGPTACGKTHLAVNLAHKFKGEIISADSRQVYRGLDIGTGKDLEQYASVQPPVPYHLIDVANPRRQFTLARYQKLAQKAIKNILKRKKIPFLVGGTGLYIKAVTSGLILPKAKADPRLRKKLENLTPEKRLRLLEKIDPQALKIIDLKNPRRVIRAIEITQLSGQKFSKIKPRTRPQYPTLKLGLTFPIEQIRKKIKKRLIHELDQGLIKEVQNLHQNSLSWQKLDSLGLEYRYAARFLLKKINKTRLIQQLNTAIGQYAKRQLTWFKKDPDIHWIKNQKQARILIQKFMAQQSAANKPLRSIPGSRPS